MVTIATFSIDSVQYLNAEGQATQEFPEFANDSAHLIDLYQQMVLLRTFDTKAIALQRTGKMGTYASTLGQEAISVALGNVMKTEDVLVPYYRDYGAMLARGVTMQEIYAYWGGDERGSCYVNNANDFPISVPISSQCLHAAGVASAFKIRKQPRVAVCTLGDGGTSEGDFYEAINVAGAWFLPMVCVINNNKWAISVPLYKQTSVHTLAQKAIAAGIRGIQVDGNDIIACHQIISEAIERAREGKGPTLIEAISYRLCDHTTADDASRYRDADELKQAWELEPIIRLRNYLKQQNVWDETKEAALQDRSEKQVAAAVEAYLTMPPAAITDIFDYHYQSWPEPYWEQRQQAIEDHQNG